jgi:hypothetical protein
VSRSELDWLPPNGIHLTVMELGQVLEALRGVIDGTVSDEPNRAHAVSITTVIGNAVSREEGEQ